MAAFALWSLFLGFACSTSRLPQAYAQSSAVPPLQWINLSTVLGGDNSPPALKDSAIGYDESSRTIIIFGGERNGFPQATTYLLNLDSLTWSRPSPPSTLQKTPPARSGALSGIDIAANSRHGFVIIGGKGSDGSTLEDAWEFDFTYSFWSEIRLSSGGPSRWGASGGIDIRNPAIVSPTLSTPTNTFYLAGGVDGDRAASLSDVWQLDISGTLSPNVESVTGSWTINTIGNLPVRDGQAGTVVGQRIVAMGGCNSTKVSGACAQADTHVIDVSKNSQISPSACPAPRVGARFVPNLNSQSSSFSSEALLMLGIFNQSLWDDGGGSSKGEIAVLDVETGTWTRLLPAGDPGSSGTATFPGPREGAAVVAYTSALVGLSSSRNGVSDTIVFGGRDASGTYLSEFWLLRSYAGAITSSGQKWSGFGSGKLQSGINANGEGVTVQFISECASAISHPGPSSPTTAISSSRSSSPTASPPSSPQQSDTAAILYDTSVSHKALAPLSAALLLPAILISQFTLVYASVVIFGAAFVLGIVGLVTSFTSITSSSTSTTPLKRSIAQGNVLKTAHGRAGLAFFCLVYILIPILAGLYLRHKPWKKNMTEKNRRGKSRAKGNLLEMSEKTPSNIVPRSSSSSPAPQWLGGRSRTSPSFGLFARSHASEGQMSGDDEASIHSTSAAASHRPRSFAVINRPKRARHASTSWMGSSEQGSPYPPLSSRSLSNVNWLERRRSLNAVSELDYAISQANRTVPQTPATTDGLVSLPATKAPNPNPQRTFSLSLVPLILLHMGILGLCVISLIALWERAPRWAFAIFLAWTVIFYLAILLVILWRQGTEQSPPEDAQTDTATIPPAMTPVSIAEGYPFPSIPDVDAGLYAHHYQPQTFSNRGPLSTGHETDPSTSYAGGPRSAETGGYDGDDDDDEDDDTRQRQIEEEMGRRDVSIITVPRRKLWIANPS